MRLPLNLSPISLSHQTSRAACCGRSSAGWQNHSAANGQAARLRAFCAEKSDNLIRLNYRDTSGNDCRPAGFHANIRNQMRLFSMLLSGLLITSPLCQTAIAQTRDCKSIADPAGRLACYDKSTPPVASSATPRPLRAAPASKADPAKYVDTIGAEDARMNAQLKNICRGC